MLSLSFFKKVFPLISHLQRSLDHHSLLNTITTLLRCSEQWIKSSQVREVHGAINRDRLILQAVRFSHNNDEK